MLYISRLRSLLHSGLRKKDAPDVPHLVIRLPAAHACKMVFVPKAFRLCLYPKKTAKQKLLVLQSSLSDHSYVKLNILITSTRLKKSSLASLKHSITSSENCPHSPFKIIAYASALLYALL